jgi:hypothetical protein
MALSAAAAAGCLALLMQQVLQRLPHYQFQQALHHPLQLLSVPGSSAAAAAAAAAAPPAHWVH